MATILIVDDDTITRLTLKQALEGEQYSVLEAGDGHDALACLQQHPVDVVLLDISMPGLNGCATCARIHAELDDPPAVFMVTALRDEDTVEEAFRVGARDFISKPVHWPVLKNRLRNVLTARRIRRERDTVERQLTRAKQEWERTVDAMPDLIALLDKEQRILRVNIPMARAMGMSPAEAVGKTCFCAVHHADAPPAYCPHQALLRDGRPHTVETFDDRLGLPLEVQVVPFFDTDGSTLLGSVHIVRDISARKQAEKEKDLLQAELLQAQKLESVGRLAAGIAHEINTPAQYVSSNVEFLDEAFASLAEAMAPLQRVLAADAGEAAPLMAPAREALRRADWDYLAAEIPLALNQSRDGLERIRSIVQAMKEFSHPGSKEKQEASLNRIIETTVTVARNEWKYVADVITDLDPNLPQLPCLVDEMGQVILNILINAAHAIAEALGENPEGAKGRITISTQRENSRALLKISDSGTGIPAEILGKIFDPFFTTKEVGKGTGQGLTIARDVIVNKHGGAIDCTSRPGEGTTFTIRLPLA